MRFLFLLIVVFLSGCSLFMDKCDSLSGWCVKSQEQEIEHWGNKEEIAKINLIRNERIQNSLFVKYKEEKRNDFYIFGLDPYSGKALGANTLNESYACLESKGYCRGFSC